MSYVRKQVPGGYFDNISGAGPYASVAEAQQSVARTRYLLLGSDSDEYSLDVLQAHFAEWQRLQPHIQKLESGLFVNTLTNEVGNAHVIRASVLAELARLAKQQQ